MIVPFEEQWQEGVARLWRASFDASPDELFSTWDWQYGANPAAKTFPVLLFVDPPEVIGMLGTIPVSLGTADGDLAASWGVDIVVHPEYRSAGVGGYLIRAWDESTTASLSLGVTPAAFEVFMSSGRIHVGEVPLFKRVLRPEALLATRLGSRTLGRLAKKPVEWWLRRRLLPEPSGHRLVMKAVESFDGSFDDLWSRVGTSHGLAVCRTAEYLEWRFANSPLGPFDIYGLYDDDRLAAYFVVTTLQREGVRSGCIADILCEDPTAARVALHRATDVLDQTGAHVVECLATGDTYREALLETGFVERPSSTSLLYRVNDADRSGALAAGDRLSAWHVTYADSDCLSVPQREADGQRGQG